MVYYDLMMYEGSVLAYLQVPSINPSIFTWTRENCLSFLVQMFLWVMIAEKKSQGRENVPYG